MGRAPGADPLGPLSQAARRKADRREAYLPTEHAQASEAARLSPPHVDARGPGDPQGETAEGASAPDGVTGSDPVADGSMAREVGRIRRRASFRALARPDGRATSRGVSVAFRAESAEADDLGAPVVAYAVGRVHGGAVVRNRLRRRLRAAVRDAAPSLPRGAYLLRADPAVSALGPGELGRAVQEASLGATRRGTPRRTAS